MPASGQIQPDHRLAAGIARGLHILRSWDQERARRKCPPSRRRVWTSEPTSVYTTFALH